MASSLYLSAFSNSNVKVVFERIVFPYDNTVMDGDTIKPCEPFVTPAKGPSLPVSDFQPDLDAVFFFQTAENVIDKKKEFQEVARKQKQNRQYTTKQQQRKNTH